MLYLFFGEDEFACEEALRDLERDYWADPTMGDLNRTILDGRQLTLAELRHHCDAIPFLADRRLVIVENLVARLDGKSRKQSESTDEDEAQEQPAAIRAKELLDALLVYLPNLPETTDLVLLDAGLGPQDSRGRVARWAAKQEGKAVVRQFSRKKGAELQGWIKKRVQQAGGQIDNRAVVELERLVGDDLRALSNEIDKLLLYPDEGEPITVEHVGRMVTHSQEASVFQILDAMGAGQWQRAVAQLRRLLQDGAHPLQILATMQWQYRLIAQAFELKDERLTPQALGKRLGVHAFPAEKAQAQARRLTREQLLETYDRLLATDLAIKTGRLEPPLALELLIIDQATQR